MAKVKKPTHDSEQGEAAMNELGTNVAAFYKALRAEGIQPSEAMLLTEVFLRTAMNQAKDSGNA
jgi:hypothetical protein